MRPDEFAAVHWMQDLGMISGKATTAQLLQRFALIKLDTAYREFFWRYRLGLRTTVTMDGDSLTDAVCILTLLNNVKPFTNDTRRYFVTGGAAPMSGYLRALGAGNTSVSEEELRRFGIAIALANLPEDDQR